jgi:hypothetical protein
MATMITVARCGLSSRRQCLSPPGREAQTVEVVGDELKAPKANSFSEGEATARQTITIGGEGERGRGNHRNVQRKSMLQIRLPGAQNVDVSALANYGVVKIARSSSKVVLQTTKHNMMYHSSGPSCEAIALRPVI